MIEVIPAIDLLDGKVVRLKQGNYINPSEYGGSPLEWATHWKSEGAQRVHVIDLNGAKEGTAKNLKSLEEIISTGLKVQFGGGIRSWEELENLFEIGVNLAILGTVAIKKRELLAQALEVYRNRIILALDERNGKIAIEGWSDNSSVSTEGLLSDLETLGLKRYIYTDISKDGTLSGPNLSGSLSLMKKFPEIRCIVSGGVGSKQDLENLAELGKQNSLANLEGVVCGKAFYENNLTYTEASEIFNGV